MDMEVYVDEAQEEIDPGFTAKTFWEIIMGLIESFLALLKNAFRA